MKLLDLTNKTFGRLTALKIIGHRLRPNGIKRCPIWECQCSCGMIKNISSQDLLSGKTKSCGCYNIDQIKVLRFKHGHSHSSRLYRIWTGIKSRCNNPSRIKYKNYGARGIKVCPEWSTSFLAFMSWAQENGYQENLQIDRIDNQGDYTPENCRWVTPLINARNRPQYKFHPDHVKPPFRGNQYAKIKQV